MKSIGGWRYLDESSNLIFPWYTKPFLEKLKTWDISSWKVFEYGCGDSTFWWRKYVHQVISVDSNLSWAEKTGAHFTDNQKDFIDYPKRFINDSLFDCIIIDGEPIEWRDSCILPAFDCLKEGGILIIDNYLQATVDLAKWEIGESFLSTKQSELFKEPDHVDWKTGYWIK